MICTKDVLKIDLEEMLKRAKHGLINSCGGTIKIVAPKLQEENVFIEDKRDGSLISFFDKEEDFYYETRDLFFNFIIRSNFPKKDSKKDIKHSYHLDKVNIEINDSEFYGIFIYARL